MNQQQRHFYLSAMGITIWQKRDNNNVSPNQQKVGHTHTLDTDTSDHIRHIAQQEQNVTQSPLPPVKTQPNSPDTSEPKQFEPSKPLVQVTLDWTHLKPAIETCQQCELAKSRNQAIVGIGNHMASLMIIGDAPADDEDRHGIPFAGKTEQLLNNMLTAINIKPQDVYMTNLVKCRPPNNRTPSKHELKQCDGFIQQQIKLIRPDLLLVVGRIAAQHLLNSKKSLTQLRNGIHVLPEHTFPVIATYHPDYLLRQTSTKAKTWQDLKKVREQLMLIRNSQQPSSQE